MTASTLLSRASAATGRSYSHADTATSFLSTLDTFCLLLDSEHTSDCPAPQTAHPASLLNLRHFRLARPIDRQGEVMPVCGLTWAQGLTAQLELASRTASWVAGHVLDSSDDVLISLWQEATVLAWYSELVARVNSVSCPYVSWQAGMLLAATAVSERLRLLEIDEFDRPELALGFTSARQIENLVIQHNFLRSLSPAASQRSSVRQGPWACVALAYRLMSEQRPMGWAERFFERSDALRVNAVLERCLVGQFQRMWPEYLELANQSWHLGTQAARVKPASGDEYRMKLHLAR